ncbi:hypothetical protein Tsubulata_024714 [Turnera subulata]|uniref:Ninja-family protein n=1 Tax=Turnera subulata TaxID=218843 RepID=A0A9Q0GDU2_9ROSI|nr:hypothetical protein Tsubulata_024714 [Turnera subulata]
MEGNKCVMVAKAAGAGLNEEGAGGEDEIELDLGLSIGGSYKRPPERAVSVQNGGVSGLTESTVVDRKMDQRLKREIQALRRQEAKRKRDEKQLKRSLSCKAKDGNFDADHIQCKKSKTDDPSGSDDHCDPKNNNPVNLNLGFPVQYPHPALQYGPPNGFVYGNVVMPCWLPGAAGPGIGNGANVVQPVARFGPFKAGMEGNGYDSEQNGSRDGGSRNAASNGSSTVCTSSAGSDRWSSSYEGGGSSDTRSHSSQSVPEQSQLNNSKENNANGRLDHSATSHHEQFSRINGSTSHVEKLIPQKNAQSSPCSLGEGPKLENLPNGKQTSAVENPATGSSNESNGTTSKPPKPHAPSNGTPSIPYMLCVSTTGNGPNGKTINGFLYRYSKAEVSIICVCHGTSFSPAEFVQHAGGTDVSNPLRHITVIPSAF